MAQTKTHYVCQSCGATQPRWLGKCPSCGQWNTLVEEIIPSSTGKYRTRSSRKNAAEPISLKELPSDPLPRISSGIEELDRVLGGGFVPASSVLFGGDPGVGKSTLLLQVAGALAAAGHGVLFVSAEESPAQIRLRSDRLNLPCRDLQVLGESEVEAALSWAEKLKPSLVVVDSIQTCRKFSLESAPGTVSQVREVTSLWSDWSKRSGGCVALVGHVTKEGAIAGPRVVEHIVDAVLFFEGDQVGGMRILRTIKNRFGPTGELGIFEMSAAGLTGIVDPSHLFLSKQHDDTSGVAVASVIRGTRPLLIEIQALVTRSFFSTAQRNATGVDPRRLAMWIAVLEKKAGLVLSGQDVFLNATGGLRLEDAGADLAAALAIYSSLHDRPLGPGTVFIGEIGLTGEVRPVSHLERRLSEAAHLAFQRAVIPAAAGRVDSIKGMEIIPVQNLDEAVQAALNQGS